MAGFLDFLSTKRPGVERTNTLLKNISLEDSSPGNLGALIDSDLLTQMTQQSPIEESGLNLSSYNTTPTFPHPPRLPRRRTQSSTEINIPQGNWDVDPMAYIRATQFAESTNNPNAVSRTGARGLMQVQPRTGREIAEKLGIPWRGSATLDDPVTNVKIGTEYLMQQLRRFGDWRKASVAYNAGPSNVAKAIEAATAAGEPHNWFPYLRHLGLQSEKNHNETALYLQNIAEKLANSE